MLRLTDPLPIDPVQLARQADTISSLTTQRDYIMREIEEERERWCVERDVWERTAEALLSQRVKPQKSEVRIVLYVCEIWINRATCRMLVASEKYTSQIYVSFA